MANLKEIRKRIRSVKNTQKITSAMKMVAAAKLKRAQDAIQAARPYGHKLKEVVSGLAALIEEEAHPLLRKHDASSGTALIIVLTSDRGLCGGFNAVLLREVDRFRKKHKDVYDIHLQVVGKKGRDWYKRQEIEHITFHPELLLNGVTFSIAKEVANGLLEGYVDGTYDHIFIAYNRFQSAMTQFQEVDRLLPIEAKQLTDGKEDDVEAADALFEPDREAMLEIMLPKYIEVQVHHAMLDSAASEQGSRMTAMDSATNNAKDMIDALTLKRNRARQAAITRELVEITSGAEALHG